MGPNPTGLLPRPRVLVVVLAGAAGGAAVAVVVVVVVVGVPKGGLLVGAVGWGGCTVGVFTRADGVRHDVVEDITHQRRRRLGAVPTLVDDGQHDVLRVRVGPEGDEPAVGLVGPGVRGRPGLAGQVPAGGKPWKSA